MNILDSYLISTGQATSYTQEEYHEARLNLEKMMYNYLGFLGVMLKMYDIEPKKIGDEYYIRIQDRDNPEEDYLVLSRVTQIEYEIAKQAIKDYYETKEVKKPWDLSYDLDLSFI